MKRPAFQFYPGDWRRDMALQFCSIAARGLWIEMLGLMHDAEPYGFLALNGKPIGPDALASRIGISDSECYALLQELEAAAVFSRDDNGTIYSRRMVRETNRSTTGTENGKLGGRPPEDDSDEWIIAAVESDLEAQTKGNSKPNSKAKSKLSVADADEEAIGFAFELRKSFEAIWSAYPRKLGRKKAASHFRASVRTEEDITAIWKALDNFKRNTASRDPEFLPYGSTWFNNWRDWVDYEPPAPPRPAPTNPDLAIGKPPDAHPDQQIETRRGDWQNMAPRVAELLRRHGPPETRQDQRDWWNRHRIAWDYWQELEAEFGSERRTA